MHNLEKAKKLLAECGYTCVLCSHSDTRTSHLRGVAPLLGWLDEGKTLDQYSAADKVVGKGAAYLYILLKIKELYADVISVPAYNTLKQYGIPVTFQSMTQAIKNRDRTGFCPIETAVMDIDNPHTALTAIRRKLEEMKNAGDKNEKS